MTPIPALVFGLWLSLQPPPAGHVSLWDLDRFPCLSTCQDYCAFGADHLCWIDRQIAASLCGRETEDWGEWRRDAEGRRDAWLALCRAHYTDESPAYRRNQLRRLRGWIGREAYDAGRMPCPVALHRFSRLDR